VKYIDEFRDPDLASALVKHICARSSKRLHIMEFCGGHTHAVMRYGIRQLLPGTVALSSGPGCPVCVTDDVDLDRAIAMARFPEVILATFGDMVRVPGSSGSLREAKAEGADVRVVYSTLDALQIARENPHRTVIFLGVGFETTAPTVAASVLQAEREGLANYFVLSLHKLTPPAMRAILDAGEVRLESIIGPGHVTTIIGSGAWRFLPQEYGIGCAVAGFEPLDILRSIAELVEMHEAERPDVANAYARSVRTEGNRRAQEMMTEVFEVAPATWRGLGELPDSGLTVHPRYAAHDAAQALPVEVRPAHRPAGCSCGEVLRGVIAPPQCSLFHEVCTPQNPIGPCMVSAEGACAAYYYYGDLDTSG
jgi:hydrogenase expression/formation protein HypD